MKTFLRKSRILIFVFVLANLFFSTAVFGQASLTLDQADLDYAPGETVYITGNGWQPGEAITLEVSNLTNPTVDCGAVEPEPHVLWTTNADEYGNFTASWYVNDCELGADLLLEAFGVTSGSTYEIFFTDGITLLNINSPIASNPVIIPAGCVVNINYSYTINNSGPNSGTATISIKSGSTTIVSGIQTVNKNVSSMTSSINLTIPPNTASGNYDVEVKMEQQNTVVDTELNSIAVSSSSIIAQPTNQTITYGGNANFVITASNATSYQWEVSTNGGGIWSNIGAATSSSLSVGTPNVAMNGNLYHCIVTNSCGTVTSNNALLTVNAKAISVSANVGQSKVYGSVDPIFIYTPSEALISGNSFTGALARTAGETVAGGPYSYSIGTLSAGANYTLSLGGSTTFAITPLAVALNADAKTKIYGDVDPALTFVSVPAVGSSLANGGTISFTGALNRDLGEDVASYVINQNTVANSNYAITYTGENLTIGQLAVAVNAEAKNKTYGDVDPALTFVSVPAVGSSLANGGTISFTGALSRAPGEDVASYAINQNTVANSNYAITYTGENLTIGQLAVAVNAEAKTKTYGDVDPALTFVSVPAVGSSLANGGTISFSGSLSRAPGEDVASYAINQNTVANSNYAITYTGENLTIGQLSVAVNADAKTKTYGDVDPALTFVSVPAVGSSLANGGTISFSGSLSRAPGEDVASYAINQNTVANSNYAITYTGANLVIGQLAVAVNADAKTKTYGDVDPALTFVSVPAVGSALANGGTVSFTGALSRAPGEDVASYAINQNTVANSNYAITYTGENLTIGQLAVAVNADAKTKTYGDVDPALTFVSVPAVGSSLANGGTISFTGSLSRAPGEDVASYAINQNTVANSNYAITYTGENLTIGQLAVAVNAEAKTKTYGDVDPALTFVSVPAVGSALANGGTISFTGALSRAPGEDVGSYAINQNTVANSNYAITYTGENLTIGQLAVAVNAEAKTKTYGDVDPALTFVSVPAVGSSLANGGTISFTGSLSRAPGEDVASYAINQNTVANSNYAITYTGENLTIGQLAVAVNAVAKNKTYGDVDPALTFVSVPAVGSSLANGGTISFTGALSRAPGEDVASYAINQNTVANSNYAITYTGENLTIGQLAVAVNAEAKTKTYGDVDPALTFVSVPAVGSALANGGTISFTGALSRAPGEDVASYAINQNTVANSNYAITYTGENLTIGQLAVAVNADAKTKTYGDVDPALTFVSVPAVGSSLANGGTISFTGALSRAPGEDVASYAINQNTVANSNYAITYTGENLTIGQLAVAVNAEAKNKTYGDVDPALTFVSLPAVGSSLANGGTISFTGALNRDLGEDVASYAINQNTVANSNYAITYTGENLTIGQLAVAVNAEAKNKTYGDVDPALTFVSVPAVGSSLANGGTISFTGALSRAPGEDVASYAINQNTVANSNYAITYTGENLTIGQLAVAVNAEAKTKTYGDVDPALTFVSVPAVGSALANGGTISFTGALSRAPGEDVASYAINQNTVANSNYAITYTGANLVIGQLSVAVNADAKNKTYGDVDPALTFVSVPAVGSSLANGGTISFSGSLSRAPGEDVASYAINQNTVANSNYAITYTGANLVIGQLAVAVNAEAKNKTYGDVDPALTFVSVPAVGSSLANGGTISFTGALSRAPGEDVASYAINQNTVANSNYAITYTGENLTIGQLAVAVNAEAKNKTYGDVDPALTFVSVPAVGSSLANGGTISFTGSLSRAPGETVVGSPYAISKNTVNNTNYAITYVGANLTITPLAVTVTADAKTKYCGQVDPSLTFVSSPIIGTVLANGETISFVGALSRDLVENAGTYAINQNTVANSNYNITFNTAVFTIYGVTIDASASSTPVPVGNTGTASATLSATVTPNVAGVVVSFYLDNLLKGTGTTNTSGVATLPVSGLVTDVYQVKAVAGSGCDESIAYLPVYDPNGGFVTGGGWINSPVNAYVANASLTGKANFGFVAKYKKGSNAVEGNTEFQFKAGDFNFKSNLLDAGTLVISGAKATYRGVGTVNGTGNYGFLVTAIDGNVSGGSGIDKFRIKVWDKNNGNAVVYDNKIGASDNADDATELAGGSIVIHQVKKNNAKTTQVVAKEEKETAIDAEPVPFNLIAYPNPAKYQFTLVVEGGSKEKIEVVLYDVLGRTVKHIESTDGQPIVFGEELPRGAYFTIVNQGANQKTVRLIKQ